MIIVARCDSLDIKRPSQDCHSGLTNYIIFTIILTCSNSNKLKKYVKIIACRYNHYTKCFTVYSAIVGKFSSIMERAYNS